MYLNAFFPKLVQRRGIQGVGFVFDFIDGQSLLADAVHQHHHAETAPEVCSIHDDVGFFGQRVALPDLRPAKAAIDGFAAASVLLGKLRVRLFACAISCPKLVVLKALAAVKTFVASLARLGKANIIMDTTYFGRGFGVMVLMDSISQQVLFVREANTKLRPLY